MESLVTHIWHQELWEEFSKLEADETAVLAVGVDLAPHYYHQVVPQPSFTLQIICKPAFSLPCLHL